MGKNELRKVFCSKKKIKSILEIQEYDLRLGIKNFGVITLIGIFSIYLEKK